MSTVYEEQLRAGRIQDVGSFPKVVLIDSVSYCNLRCSMCLHSSMTRTKGFMPWPLFTKIIDEIAARDKDTRVWMVFFGEGLIRKRFKPSIFDMIAYAKERGLRDVVMNSNGMLLDAESARALIDAGLDALYVGIDAIKPESYAKIRIGGTYQTTVDNVLGLVALKRELGVSHPEVYAQFVTMDLNAGEEDAFTAFWGEHGVTVKIRPKVSWAGGIDAPNLVLDDRDRWPCYWAMQTMSITDTGKVVTCAVDLDAHHIAGDSSTQSLHAIWNGPLKALRDLHETRRFAELPRHCASCRDWQAARADYSSQTQ